MNLRKIAVIGALLFLGSSIVFLTTQALSMTKKKSPLKIGEKAPDFTLSDSQGNLWSLSEQRDKIVVLEWWNHQCPYVRKHYSSGNMQKLQKETTKEGIVWFSIVSSAPRKQGYLTPAQAEQVRRTQHIASTAVLLDPEGRVGRLYGAKTTPHMFVIDKKGNLAYMGAIDSIASADPEDIPEAENYVFSAVQALLAGKKPEPAATKPYGCSVKY